jgi:HD superfamily phosphodiesterase
MGQKQLYFIEVLAWLHDIGRFEQYHKYRTFDDSVSENHAVLGLKVIEQEKILDGFSSDHQEILTRSILNHNIRSVPQNEPKQIDFYSRILRDADKLDIWRITIEMNIMFKLQEDILPKTYSVPHFFIQNFKDRQTLKIEQAKTMHDTTLFRLSWIYDLNFRRSLEMFRERKIGQKLLNKVPLSPPLEQIGRLVEEFIDEKCISISF